jgi:hypothetical protein
LKAYFSLPLSSALNKLRSGARDSEIRISYVGTSSRKPENPPVILLKYVFLVFYRYYTPCAQDMGGENLCIDTKDV